MDIVNRTTMQMKVETITPEQAIELLKSNTSNRVMSKSAVRKYAALMKKGEWYLSHQAIAFADTEDGSEVLVDGQHRLAAVVQAGIPITFTVIRRAIQTPYIDTARNRSFIDNLNIFNSTKKYTPTMKAIINLLAQIDKISNMTQRERQLFCDFYFDTFEKVDQIYKRSSTKSGGYPLKAALFLVYNEHSQRDPLLQEKLNNYMYVFNTGNVSNGDDGGIYVKEMRDHYYLQNREFNRFNTSNSASYKRKILTSIFLYSIECYILNNRYIPAIDMESSLKRKVEKQMKVIK